MPIWNHVNAETSMFQQISRPTHDKTSSFIMFCLQKSSKNPFPLSQWVFPMFSPGFLGFPRCNWRPSRRISPTSAAARRRCGAWEGSCLGAPGPRSWPRRSWPVSDCGNRYGALWLFNIAMVGQQSTYGWFSHYRIPKISTIYPLVME